MMSDEMVAELLRLVLSAEDKLVREISLITLLEVAGAPNDMIDIARSLARSDRPPIC